MASSNELSYSIIIDAPQSQVWRALTDWERQSTWMAMTHVSVLSHGSELGTEIFALTGLWARRNISVKKYFGIMDHMIVTQWQPPVMCEVEHVGKIIKGIGRFTLQEISPHRTRFDWYEKINAPEFLIRLIRPAIMLGVRFSLRRFSRLCNTQ